MTSTPPIISRTPSPSESPILNPVSPLTPISPWPPIPAPQLPSSSTDDLKPNLPNATDVYSSIAILGTYLSFALYIFWAFSPKECVWLGWLPDRQWAIIVPCWLMIVVLLTYWSYAALVIYRTPDWDSADCITDPYAGIPPLSISKHNSKSHTGSMDRQTPFHWDVIGDQASSQAVDLPIDLVNRVLYPPRRSKG